MRDILFRGKTLSGEWVKGSFCNLNDKINIIYCDEFNFFNVIPETVSQYIGKNDINDNMIFEGDIVEAKNDIGYARIKQEDYGLYVIRFNDNSPGFMLSRDGDGYRHFIPSFMLKVVGNIFDNPEILKKEPRKND